MMQVTKYIIEFSKNFNNTLFSIDTYNSEVANFALKNGFAIINDIGSGKYDPKIIFNELNITYQIKKL